MAVETTEWEHTCPWCGERNEAATGPDGLHPDDGSLLVCYYCRQPSVAQMSPYGLIARMPTERELITFRNHPQYKQALAAIAESRTALQAANLLRRPEEFGD